MKDRSLKLVGRLAVGLLAIVALGGCDRRSAHLKPDELLPRCTTSFTIPVTEIATMTLSCTPIGSFVVFPDGFQFEVRRGSHGADRGSVVYEVVPFGKYGVAAMFQEQDEPAQWWGSTDKAIELGKYLYGSR